MKLTVVIILSLGSLVCTQHQQYFISGDKGLGWGNYGGDVKLLSGGGHHGAWSLAGPSKWSWGGATGYASPAWGARWGGGGAGLSNINTGLSSFYLGGVPSAAYMVAPKFATTGLVGQWAGGLTGGANLIAAKGADIAAIDNAAVLVQKPVAASVGLVTAGHALAVPSQTLSPVTAAVQSLRRTVDYVPVPYSGEAPQTQVVNVPPNEQGLHINVVSKSSPLTVSQQHIAGEPGQVHVTESEDEPHRLVHNVKKSVLQEVNEVVQPYRVLKTEVKPVIEQGHTLVAQGEHIPLSGRVGGIIATEPVLAKPSGAVLVQKPIASAGLAVVAQPALHQQRVISVVEPSVTYAEPALSAVAIEKPALAVGVRPAAAGVKLLSGGWGGANWNKAGWSGGNLNKAGWSGANWAGLRNAGGASLFLQPSLATGYGEKKFLVTGGGAKNIGLGGGLVLSKAAGWDQKKILY